MLTVAAHADVIRARVLRAIAHLRDHADLLARCDLDAELLVGRITATADDAISLGLRAYQFTVIGTTAGGIGRVSDRLTGARAYGPLHARVIESGAGHPDGDRLSALAINLQAIDADRPDSDLLPV